MVAAVNCRKIADVAPSHLCESRPVIDGVINVRAPLPQTARRLITFDRAAEFSEQVYLQAGSGSQPWSCDPQSWRTPTDAHNAGFPETLIRSPSSGTLQFEF